MTADTIPPTPDRHERIEQQYNDASAHYDRAKTLPYAMAEQATIRSVLPDLSGRRVLDVGCGTGFYTRTWRRLGAREVLGVDVAAGMIDVAREIERSESLGVTYDVADGARIPRYGQYDVVTPIWVFNYARNVAEHHDMVARCAENLAPGGTMVALCSNPDIDLDGMSIYPRYGLTITAGEQLGDMSVCHIRLDLDPAVAFDGFFWRPGTVEESMRRAGLTEIRRHPVAAPGHAPGDPGEGYWRALVDNAPFALFTASRP